MGPLIMATIVIAVTLIALMVMREREIPEEPVEPIEPIEPIIPVPPPEPQEAYFEKLYCSNFYHTSVSGWPIDQITFNWEIISKVGVPAALMANLSVNGKDIWNGGWESGELAGSKTIDCAFFNKDSPASGVYSYTVTMRMIQRTNGVRTVCEYTHKGTIIYDRG